MRMPTYVYRCSGCEDEYTIELSFSEHDEFDPGVHEGCRNGRFQQVLNANIDKSSLR